jgi:hypothetical protein
LPAEILSPSSTNEVEYRASLALSTAFAMMVRLASVHDRRKAVIYISNGYNVDVWPGAVPTTAANRKITPRDRLGVSQLREEMSQLIGAAARANVKVFAIDPRRPAGGTGRGAGVDSEALRKYWDMSQNSLRVMSEQAGGFALLDEADLADGLERISRTMRRLREPSGSSPQPRVHCPQACGAHRARRTHMARLASARRRDDTRRRPKINRLVCKVETVGGHAAIGHFPAQWEH